MNAFVWRLVFNVNSYQVKQLRQETDTKEDLSWSIHAPIQQVNQWNYTIRLQHVIPVFTQGAEQ